MCAHTGEEQRLKLAALREVARVAAAALHVPRLVAPQKPQATTFAFALDSLLYLLDAHVARATADLDMEHLLPAYALNNQLCQQYVRDALNVLRMGQVPIWHHKLLCCWCCGSQKVVEVKARVCQRDLFVHDAHV